MNISAMDGDIAADLERLRRFGAIELPKASRMGTLAAVTVAFGLVAAAIWIAVFPPPGMSTLAQALALLGTVLGSVAVVGLYAACAVERQRRLDAEARLKALEEQEPGITWKHLRLSVRECVWQNSEVEAAMAETITSAILHELINHRKEIIALLKQQGQPTWT